MLIIIFLFGLTIGTDEINAEFRYSYWMKVTDISSIALEQTYQLVTSEKIACLLRCNEVECNVVVMETSLNTCYGYSFATSANTGAISITNSMDLYCQNERCDDYTCSTSLNLCYKLHSREESWMDAKQSCENENATLIIIETMDQLQLLAELHTGISSMLIWVGANDLQTEGAFVWLNGQPVPFPSTLWRAGDPNDPDGGEDCIGFYPTGLVDAPCPWASSFVCQK